MGGRSATRRSSEPAMLSIPVECTPDPVAQPDARIESDFRARARDVERAALGEEFHAAPMKRRLDTERRANRLADDRRRAEGPYRQVPPGRRHASFEGHQL